MTPGVKYVRTIVKAAFFAAVMSLASHQTASGDEKKPLPPATTTSATCGGRDLLSELALSDRPLFDRLLSEAKATENGSALLWKVEKQGKPPSHLFGTVHLTDERVTRLSDKTQSALSASTTVMLEAADVSPATTAAALSAAAKSAMFTDGKTLDALLTAEEFQLVSKAVDKAGIPGALARVYRPWIVTMLIAASDCERSKVQSGVNVLDMAISEQAKALGKPVAGLETIEQQLAALSSVPDDQQIGMLRANLALADKTDDLMETMVNLYLNRRMGAAWHLQLALAEKAGVGAEAFEGFKQRLIIERNQKMRDAALPYLSAGGAFIAVGALHLPEKTGLVTLLRDAGYTITPVE
jgi:uncharacterized protein YbaP (TraB family)